MKSLIIGASGFLGAYLLKEAKKFGAGYGTGFTTTKKDLLKLDIRDYASVKKIITQIKPDIIFIPAAQTHVDYCEDHADETAEINVTGIQYVVDALNEAKKKYKIVYFSTSYVFDGNKGLYKETDNPNPINEYGKQKLAAEKYIQTHVKDFLIIRTTEIYGWEKNNKNFVAKLIIDNKEKKVRKIPDNLIGTPTYVINLVELTSALINRNKKGIFHIVGSDNLNRYAFAKEIAKVFNLDESLLISFTLTGNENGAKRPLSSGLSVSKLAKTISHLTVGIKEGLQEMKKIKSI